MDGGGGGGAEGAACNTVVCSIAESAANLYCVLPKHNPNSLSAEMSSSFCVGVLYFFNKHWLRSGWFVHTTDHVNAQLR